MRTSRAHRRARALVIGSAGALLALGVVGCASDDPETAGASAPPSTPAEDENDLSQARTITVTGEGSVSVRPDIATVQMGVRVSGQTAQDVLDQTSEKATTLITALEALGVASDDITTSGLSIYPRYDDKGEKVIGFEAFNGVDVILRDLSRAGEIIDGGAAFAGEAVTIGGIWFDVDDPEGVIADARADAVANAEKRAGEYAAAAGVEVGEVLVISEGDVSVPRSPMEGAAADAATVPISPGTTELTVTVTVVFELR